MMKTAPVELYNRIRNEFVGKIQYIDEASPSEPEIDPIKGCGCWGFVWFLENECGIVFPKDGWEFLRSSVAVKDPAQFLDVAVFKAFGISRTHVGMMLNDRLMVHCSRQGGGVSIDDIRLPPWIDNRGKIRHTLLRHPSLA